MRRRRDRRDRPEPFRVAPSPGTAAALSLVVYLGWRALVWLVGGV